MRRKHEVSIITGAAQGLGLATALKLAEEGALPRHAISSPRAPRRLSR